MDSKSTPVSRPIRIIALDDRWLVRREGQEWKYDAEIQLQDGPQVAGEKLEQAIRERVDSWGLSLPGGYWVPSLTVEAATDADTSVQRLKRLLDGSGVIIKVEPLQTHSSSANTSPNQLPSQQLPIQQATNQKLDSRPSIAPQRQAITPEFPKRK